MNKTTIRKVLLDPNSRFRFTPGTLPVATSHKSRRLRQHPQALYRTPRMKIWRQQMMAWFSPLIPLCSPSPWPRIPPALADPHQRTLRLYIEDHRPIATIKATVVISSLRFFRL
ncbi:hypothetical protein Hypma_000333 [Hypsizygus marmoreus]|uniref:Uncharacterized protein n=1 Tax=Hypsizygus marmoreus TaxID=39966 RepID=A0A369JDJ8_HYPMA|nr:hypothetical protein Hypma_000333 [Hypsizygus marmoreus]